jgi:hypothetical protein
MRFFLILSSLILASCVAIPRGSYYFPTHPLGEAKSGTCDKNSNKIALEIPLEEGITITSSLLSNIDGTSTLSIYISLSEGTSISLASNDVIWQGTHQAPEKYIIDEWNYKLLVGEKVIQIYRGNKFEYDKSFGAKIIMDKLEHSDFSLILPEFMINGSKIQLDPIKFKFRSGEVQWLPKLNC